MEWVEVRGETLEQAKEEALDQLGVAADDAEFEIVQEPETRWLGMKKTEARVRARVRPTQPRPKRDSRNGRNKHTKATPRTTDNSRAKAPITTAIIPVPFSLKLKKSHKVAVVRKKPPSRPPPKLRSKS